jgi:plasmid stabilization system protein ParE
MRIEWTDIAFRDLESTRNYIAQDSTLYANHFIDKLICATEILLDFPEIGRRVPEAGGLQSNIREVIFQGYRIIYRYREPDQSILILTVVHGSRDLANRDPAPWNIG